MALTRGGGYSRQHLQKDKSTVSVWPGPLVEHLRLHLLWVQVGPSHPSLQTQVKASLPPTHVPPLWQGPESHVLFLAATQKQESLQASPRRPARGVGVGCLTRVAGAAAPTGQAAAQEGVSVVVACAAVAAGGGVALAHT